LFTVSHGIMDGRYYEWALLRRGEMRAND